MNCTIEGPQAERWGETLKLEVLEDQDGNPFLEIWRVSITLEELVGAWGIERPGDFGVHRGYRPVELYRNPNGSWHVSGPGMALPSGTWAPRNDAQALQLLEEIVECRTSGGSYGKSSQEKQDEPITNTPARLR